MKAPTHLALGSLSNLSQVHELTTGALDADDRHRHSETQGSCIICAQYYKHQFQTFKNNK